MRVLVLLCVVSCAAQSPDELLRKKEAEANYHGSAPARGGSQADKRTAESFHLLAASLLESEPLVLHKPFRAETETRVGTRVNTGRVYRDGQGRTRREVMINTLGAQVAGEIVVLADPARKVDSILDPVKKAARSFPHLEIVSKLKPIPGEDLGERVIEGLNCRGKRQVVGPIVTELWYSTAIEAIVHWTKDDPRYGRTSWSLRQVTVGEPPAEVFQIPADYKVESEALPGIMMKRKSK